MDSLGRFKAKTIKDFAKLAWMLKSVSPRTGRVARVMPTITFFLLAFIGAVQCIGTPTFTPASVDAAECGTSVTLTCHLDTAAGATVVRIVKPTENATDTSPEWTADGTLSVSLPLNPLTAADDGEYLCQSADARTTGNNKETATNKPDISCKDAPTDKPKIKIANADAETTTKVKTAANVTLTCGHDSGVAPVSDGYRWYTSDAEEGTEKKETFEVTNVKDDDNGPYKCRYITLDGGSPYSDAITLKGVECVSDNDCKGKPDGKEKCTNDQCVTPSTTSGNPGTGSTHIGTESSSKPTTSSSAGVNSSFIMIYLTSFLAILMTRSG